MPILTESRCEWCGNSFLKSTKRRFCSRSCSAYGWKRSRKPIGYGFWEKVDKSGPVPAHQPHLGPCWIWIPSTRNGGSYYGYTKDGLAHRVAWFLTHGAWPTWFACHRCDNPPCVNPAHLFDGTHQDNNADMHAKSRGLPPPVRIGAANGNSKMNESSVTELRQLYASGGITQVSLAAQFGITQAVVSQIVRRVTWRHVA